MQKKWCFMALVTVLALSAGCGGDGEPDPAADRAAAQKANLEAADFPSGWRSKPHEELPGEDELAAEVAECLGLPAPSTGTTAEVRSPDFTSGLATQASSVVTFVESEEVAEKHAAALAGGKFPACAEPGFAKQVGQVAPEGATVTDVNITKVDFPALGDRTVAHRVKATINIGEMKVPINIDLVHVFEDRAEVALTFVNPGSPFDEDLARSLAAKVLERL